MKSGKKSHQANGQEFGSKQISRRAATEMWPFLLKASIIPKRRFCGKSMREDQIKWFAREASGGTSLMPIAVTKKPEYFSSLLASVAS